jgi:hypothetical protein
MSTNSDVNGEDGYLFSYNKDNMIISKGELINSHGFASVGHVLLPFRW